MITYLKCNKYTNWGKKHDSRSHNGTVPTILVSNVGLSTYMRFIKG